MPDDQCLFCEIINGSIPSKKVFENNRVLAFSDIDPRAPVHVIIVPKGHVVTVHGLSAADGGIANDLFDAVTSIVKQLKLEVSGYRLVINAGQHGGQAVPHLHVHLLAGRELGWPPG